MIRVLLGVIGVAVAAVVIAVLLASGTFGTEPPPRLALSPTVPVATSAATPAPPVPSVPPGRRLFSPTPLVVPVRPSVGEVAEVVRVVDGDTIDVRRADGSVARVRYIGVNTPETVDPRRPVECFGKEASARNSELVAGKTVLLEKDISETDQFGRLLRYVWVGETLVNAALVGEGYARPVTYPPDVRYVDWYHQREREARAAGRGLWGACRS